MAGDQDHVSPSVPGTTREDLRKALLAERERCQLPEDATAEEDQAFEDEKQSLQIKLIQNRYEDSNTTER